MIEVLQGERDVNKSLSSFHLLEWAEESGGFPGPNVRCHRGELRWMKGLCEQRLECELWGQRRRVQNRHGGTKGIGRRWIKGSQFIIK